LKEKTEQLAQREADIIEQLDKQSEKFLGTSILPFLLRFWACTNELPSFQQSVLVGCTRRTRNNKKMGS
jgi:hypothetical protein